MSCFDYPKGLNDANGSANTSPDANGDHFREIRYITPIKMSTKSNQPWHLNGGAVYVLIWQTAEQENSEQDAVHLCRADQSEFGTAAIKPRVSV